MDSLMAALVTVVETVAVTALVTALVIAAVETEIVAVTETEIVTVTETEKDVDVAVRDVIVINQFLLGAVALIHPLSSRHWK